MLWVFDHYKYFFFSVRGSTLAESDVFCLCYCRFLCNTKHTSRNVVTVSLCLMLGQRLRLWINMNPVLGRVGVNSFLSIPNSIPILFYQFLSQFQFLWFYEKSMPIQFQFLKSQFLINSTQE